MTDGKLHSPGMPRPLRSAILDSFPSTATVSSDVLAIVCLSGVATALIGAAIDKYSDLEG